IDSVEERLLQAVNAEIVGQALAGLSNSYVRTIPTVEHGSITFPCTMVTCDDESEEENEDESSFEEIAVIYPVKVHVLDRRPSDDQTVRPFLLGLRQALMVHFRSMFTFNGVTECYDVKVKPKVIVDKSLPWYQMVVTSFGLA